MTLIGPWRARKGSPRKEGKKTKEEKREGKGKVEEGKMEKGKEFCGWFWVGQRDGIGRDLYIEIPNKSNVKKFTREERILCHDKRRDECFKRSMF